MRKAGWIQSTDHAVMQFVAPAFVRQVDPQEAPWLSCGGYPDSDHGPYTLCPGTQPGTSRLSRMLVVARGTRSVQPSQYPDEHLAQVQYFYSGWLVIAVRRG
jgi:hypothetical protein